MNQKVREQWNGPASAAFLLAAQIGRAGDIQVRPFQIFGELGQEGGSCDGAAFAAADVRHVRKVALQLLGILFSQGQLPRAVVYPHARSEQLARQRIVVTHEAAEVSAQRDYTRASERCDVYYRRRIESPRVIERVGQHEAALRIRV